MLTGTTCRLRNVTEHDLEMLRIWRTSNEIRPYFTDKWLYSPIEQKRWFESMSADSKQRFLIAEDSAGAAYGIVNVQSINYQHGTATVGWYFVRENGRPPKHGDERDIFERLYAVRLDRIRDSEEFRDLLRPMDEFGLLSAEYEEDRNELEPEDEDAMLAELGKLQK
jgi:hypothetical protein